MRTPRIYIASALSPTAQVTLDAQTSNYLIKVLRMEVDRPLIAFNGDGAEYPSTLLTACKRSATIKIGRKEQINRESPLHTHLAIAVSRGDRMDWILQKATELGATEITPLFTERTEVKLKGERLQKKMTHWQKITISACEQCQRNTLPKINPACTIEAFLQHPQEGLKFVLHHRTEQSLKNTQQPKAVTLLIGPEGGLSNTEITQALEQSQFTPLSFGSRVLRTETAPIAALSAIQFLWGDLG